MVQELSSLPKIFSATSSLRGSATQQGGTTTSRAFVNVTKVFCRMRITNKLGEHELLHDAHYPFIFEHPQSSEYSGAVKRGTTHSMTVARGNTLRGFPHKIHTVIVE